mgnify:CR=1 FL=1
MKKLPDYKEHKDRQIRINSAVNAARAISQLDLYPSHKRELLSVCIWKITEADGKNKVRYWSAGTIDNPEKKIQHEHVVTRKELVDLILAGVDAEILASKAIACMVTESEHILLGNQKAQGWQRYKDANIRVFDAKNKDWLW